MRPIAIAAVATAVALMGCAGPASQDAGPPETLEISPIGMLRELHVQMVEQRLPLVEAQVLAAAVNERDVVVTVLPHRVLWSPAGAPAPAATPTTYYLRRQPLTEVEYWQAVRPPMTVLAVASADELVAVAPTSGPGGEMTADIASSGALFLGHAAKHIASTDYVPVTVLDHCGQPNRDAVADSARAALVDYLGRLGMEPELTRMALAQDLERQAEGLVANAPSFHDPVTGQPVGVSINDVVRQLEGGVPPDEVRLEPTVPVQLDVTGLAPRLQETPAREAAVFVELPTRRVLGWVPVVGAWSQDDAGRMVPDFVIRADIIAPLPDHDVAVLRRDIQAADFDCPPDAIASGSLVVPYDDLAGKRRSAVRLESRSYGRAALGK